MISLDDGDFMLELACTGVTLELGTPHKSHL